MLILAVILRKFHHGFLSLDRFVTFSVVVVSKTFTTAETMLNARTLREWISAALGLVHYDMNAQPYSFSIRLSLIIGYYF